MTQSNFNQSNEKGTILKWSVGSLLILIGLYKLFSSSIIGGFLLAIVGVALLPPVASKIKMNYTFWQNNIVRKSVLGFLTIMGLLISSGGKDSAEKKNVILAETQKSEISDTLNENVSVESKKEASVGNEGFWSEFPPEVKEEVSELVKSKNCHGLQRYFDFTADNHEQVIKRGGKSPKHLDLMDYLDDKMVEFGCH